MAGDILKYLYESLDSSFTLQARTNEWESKGVLTKFAQREFLGTTSIFQYDGFDEYGWIYYPNACLKEGAKCKLHFYLHGCLGTAAIIGEVTFRNIGFLEYAATNDIIVVFP